MAEKKDDIQIIDEGSGKKTKLLIIIIAVLVIVIGGLAAYLLAGKDSADAEEDAEKALVKHAPIYAEVESPFVINFSEQSHNAVRYMQVKMKVMARDQLVIDAFQLHLPAIQHEILMLLYSQNYDDLLTTEGTKALQQACLDTINTVIKSEESSLENELEAVYFSSFIMQ